MPAKAKAAKVGEGNILLTLDDKIQNDEGYTIKSVKLGEDELVPVEGVYTIPALKADVTITITVEKNEVTAIINGQQQAVSRKVLRDGQLLIIRNEATFNAQGQVVK